tara:strand:- start:220 stop:858 length:639 start_codon:yes stop_codon:yes gene_type:complete
MAFATIGTRGIQAQSVDLSSKVTGTLPVPNGGLGIASGTTGQFLKFTGTETLAPAEAGGGITEADQWRITTSWNGSANPITSNWERNDTVFDKIGTGMTQSSGNFTFPSTGIYKVEFILPCSKGSGDTQYAAAKINVTTDNSNYELRATNYAFINEAGGETYSGVYCCAIVDVTDTSNVKVQFGVVNQSATDFYGDTNNNKTTATFIRLGDT